MNAREMERIEEQARGRGYLRGCVDRESGVIRDLAPLSGERAGESVRELLGDLIDSLARLGVDECDAEDVLCIAYDEGYSDGFGPVPETLSVCPDCFDWFASFAGATESPAGECPAGVAYWDDPARFVIMDAGESDCFSWAGCDTCRTTLGGPRYTVAVFDSGEDSAG